MFLPILAAACGLLCQVQAHGEHAHSPRPVVPEGADWTTRHMIGRHASFRETLMDLTFLRGAPHSGL